MELSTIVSLTGGREDDLQKDLDKLSDATLHGYVTNNENFISSSGLTGRDDFNKIKKLCDDSRNLIVHPIKLENVTIDNITPKKLGDSSTAQYALTATATINEIKNVPIIIKVKGDNEDSTDFIFDKFQNDERDAYAYIDTENYIGDGACFTKEALIGKITGTLKFNKDYSVWENSNQFNNINDFINYFDAIESSDGTYVKYNIENIIEDTSNKKVSSVFIYTYLKQVNFTYSDRTTGDYSLNAAIKKTFKKIKNGSFSSANDTTYNGNIGNKTITISKGIITVPDDLINYSLNLNPTFTFSKN